MAETGITGVNTIGIPVGDQDVALAFYRDSLGFELLVDAPLPTGGRWIMLAPAAPAAPAAPTVSVSLVVASDDVPAGVETGIRFETLDAGSTHEELARRGVRVGELLRWPGVPVMFQATDPDGNRFEVVERG